MRSVGLLHITDLHWGAPAGATLYDAAHAHFLKDLEAVQDLAGASPEFILFTGDLAYAGTGYDEFAERALQPLLDRIRHSTGTEPLVLAVPGNHDLVLPLAGDVVAHSLLSHAAQGGVHRAIWPEIPESSGTRRPLGKGRKRPQSKLEYWPWLAERFTNYQAWWDGRWEQMAHRLSASRRGALPGEYRVSCVSRHGVRVGIVALNSAFLHFAKTVAVELDDGTVARSCLAIGVEQLDYLFPADDPITAWSADHDIRILLTHHPLEWLSPEARAIAETSILPHFHVHLCGHLHRPSSRDQSLGGGPHRRTFVAPSLFGLQKVNDRVDRLHGYTFLRAFARDSMDPVLEVWPRRHHKKLDGEYRPGPDHEFTLDPHTSSFLSPRDVSSWPRPRLAEILAARSARIEALYDLTRRIDQFRATASAFMLDADGTRLNHAFSNHHRSFLSVLQDAGWGQRTTRVELHVLYAPELQERIDEVAIKSFDEATSRDLTERWLPSMRLLREEATAGVSGLSLDSKNPGVAPFVMHRAAAAATRLGAEPGVAIAHDVHHSTAIEFFDPLPAKGQYARAIVENIFKHVPSGNPRFRSLLVAPIFVASDGIESPSRDTAQTRSAILFGTLNISADEPHRFDVEDVAWVRGCASLWGMMHAHYIDQLNSIESLAEISRDDRASSAGASR